MNPAPIIAVTVSTYVTYERYRVTLRRWSRIKSWAQFRVYDGRSVWRLAPQW